MKDISDLEFMINSLYKKWKYHVGHTYEWQKKNEAMFNDIVARLEALERRTYESDEGGCDEGTFDPEPCQQVPTDKEITTLSYEFSDEVETGDDYFMTVVDPVGFAHAVLERWGRKSK